MARQNLISNPSFTTGISGWTARQGSTISAHTQDGRACLKVVKSILDNSGAITTAYIPVTAGLAYSVSGYFFIPTGEPTSALTFSVIWYTYDSGTQEYVAAGTPITATPVSVAAGQGWVRVTQLGTAPAGVTHARVSAYQPLPGLVDKIFLVDSVLLEQSNYVGSFIDVINQAQETEIVNRALSEYHDLNHLTGLQLNADVQLGELVFNTIDEDEIVWICTDIDGWWTTAEPASPDIPRGFQDGSYDVSGRYSARVLTLTGVFITKRPGDVGAAREKLLNAVDLVRKGAWLRTSENPTRAAFVRLSGKPSIITVNARGRTEFTVGLKAADPIKYKWDDSKFDGVTVGTLDLATKAPNDYGSVTLVNEGTVPVTASLVITGPLGAGSTIRVDHAQDASTQTMTIIEELRGKGPVATVSFVEMNAGKVTITTLEQHGLSVGEVVSVSGTSGGSINTETATVTAVTDTLPYSFNYTLPTTASVAKVASSGVVSLKAADEMIVDTYNRNVTVNGDTTGYRSKLDTLTDWVTLYPGSNTITFTDSIDPAHVTVKAYDPATNIATLTTGSSHFITAGQSVAVNLPTAAEIAYKSITSSVATLTTKTAHGFSNGDLVNVATTLTKNITNKAMTTGTARLTISLAAGETLPISVDDVVLVSLSTSATAIKKQRTGTTITLTTGAAHGFSTGDTVTVLFPVDNYVAAKQFASNVVTITTQTPHGFSTLDQVSIALPTTTTATAKTITGTQVVLTTSSAHNYSIGDKITVALAEGATMTSARTFYGSSTFSITNSEASTSECTLTTSVAHNIAVGDAIAVSGVGARYNGTFTAKTGTTGSTVVYDFAGALTASTPSVGSVTDTTRSYRALITTDAAHGFVIGDAVTISIGIPSTATVTNRSASTTACTLRSAGHKYAVGQSITVSGVPDVGGLNRYNGTFPISGVTTDTITYLNNGAAESPEAASVGTITNNMIANGYNGTKIVTSVPSSTTFTYLYYGQDTATADTNAGTSPTLVNATNTALNGTVTLTAASGTSLTYTKGA